MEQYELKGVLSETATGVEFENGKAMSRVLRKWKDKTLHIVIKPFKRKRSENQNRYLWGCAYVCIQAYLKETEGSAPTKEEIHLHNLQIIQGVKIESKVILGETVFTINEKRTSSMSTVEFNEMKEKLQAYWAERDCIIPDPNEDNFLTDFAKRRIMEEQELTEADKSAIKFGNCAIDAMNNIFEFLDKAVENGLDTGVSSVSMLVSESTEESKFKGQIVVTFIGDPSSFMKPNEIRVQAHAKNNRTVKVKNMNLCLIFSDYHLHDYRQFNTEGKRLKNCVKVLYDIAEFAEKNNIKYVLFGGDWYDQQKELPTKVVNASIAAIQDITVKYPDLIWIMISGNHDYATKNLWHSPAVTALTHIAATSNNFNLIDNGVYRIGETSVVGIPYYEMVEDYNLALDNAVHHTKDLTGKKVLMVHQTPKGIGNAMIKADTDPHDSRYDNFDYVYCGHIHKRQDLTDKFTVIGSPIHRDLGDAGESKGFLVMNLDKPEKGYKFVELTGYPHFVQIMEGEERSDIDEVGAYVVEKPNIAQISTAKSMNADRFNTGLTPKELLKNYWEEVNGKDNELLEVGLECLGI